MELDLHLPICLLGVHRDSFTLTLMSLEFMNICWLKCTMDILTFASVNGTGK